MMARGPRKPQPKFSRWGVPINRNDWTVEDWKAAWLGTLAIRAAIARNHGNSAMFEKEMARRTKHEGKN
jgi:hypothetical protein